MNIIDFLTPKQKKLLDIKEYHKDDILFREGDSCENVGIIIEGKASILSYLPDGNIINYNNLKENDMFGHNLILSSNPFYKGNIIAKSDLKVAIISSNNFLKLLKTNDQFLNSYIKAESDFTKSLNNKIKLLSISNASERLIYYLYSNNSFIEYSSITDLADELYLQRETLSRTITKLIKINIIRKNGNTIKLV